MIICSCQSISDNDVNAAINWMRAADPQTLITPGKIYHALGKKADCGGCMPLFLQTMRENTNLEVPPDLRALGPFQRKDTPMKAIPRSLTR